MRQTVSTLRISRKYKLHHLNSTRKACVASDANKGRPVIARPIPSEEQLSRLERLGKDLVHAAVARKKVQTPATGKRISLEEQKRTDDKKLNDIARRGKSITQEKLKFDTSPNEEKDFTGITLEPSDIDDTSLQPQPGAFVELRRWVEPLIR